MNIIQNAGEITIELEGRLDTITAPELTQEIQKLEFDKLTVKLDKLQYISSAGLRSLLVCQKTANEQGAKMTVTNPSAAVMDVLKMSGFLKMLTVINETL